MIRPDFPATAGALVRDDDGACLAEILIALAAGLMVLGSSIQAVDMFQKRLVKQQTVMGLQQDQRLGLHVLEEELRQAGSAMLPTESAIVVAESQRVEFFANVDGLSTTTTAPLSSAHTQLTVADGSDWKRGKRIVIRDGVDAAAAWLAQDGRRASLTVTESIGRAFPSGAEVQVSNRVRYYLSAGADGIPALMRQVDGGTNPLIAHVMVFRLRYLTRDGVTTANPAEISRVVIDLGVGYEDTVLSTEVALRNG